MRRNYDDKYKHKFNKGQRNSKDTSWQHVAGWYQKTTGSLGHYYHNHIIIPGIKKLMDLTEGKKILDLACGPGVLARNIPETVQYTGIDLSENLINSAQKQNRMKNRKFLKGDVTRDLSVFLNNEKFDYLTMILAMQNIRTPQEVFVNAGKMLLKKGKMILVLNHPCFRIPRQSSWEIDPANKLQYRRINRYLTSLEIPLKAHPGQGDSSKLIWTYHHPLSFYAELINKNNLVIENILEWSSDKVSEGKAKRMENLSRNEIPMFMCLVIGIR